jgi:hypothetical protein
MDFVVAEVVVDLRLYPDGYDVNLSSQYIQHGGSHKPISVALFNGDGTPAEREESTANLPLSHVVYVLPPSPLHSSSSSPSTELPTRHLLRITLPTAQYLLPAVDDPLTGQTRTAPPKPSWFCKLEEDDTAALVAVSIRPLAEDQHKKGRKVVRVDGNGVNILSSEGLRNDAADGVGLGLLSR